MADGPPSSCSNTTSISIHGLDRDATRAPAPVAALPDIREIHTRALVCIAAEAFDQAIDFFSQALELVSPASASCAVSASLLSDADLAVSLTSLTASLLLQRAECYVRVWHYEHALADIDRLVAMSTSSTSTSTQLTRVHCEALLGLKQEQQALQIWAAALLTSPTSPELELLKTKYPIAAVHVLHAVKLAEQEAVERLAAFPPVQAIAVEELLPDSVIVSEETVTCSTTMESVENNRGSAHSSAVLERSGSQQLTDNTFQDEPAADPDPFAGDDLAASFATTTLSDSAMMNSSLFFQMDHSLIEFPSRSMSSKSGATTPNASIFGASFVRVDKPPDSTSEQLFESSIDIRDSSTVLRHSSIDPEAAAASLSSRNRLYDHALSVEALPSSSSEEKIHAYLQYISLTSLDDEWMPQALYSLSALYIDSRDYNEAARMRFLAEECEKLRERVGRYDAIDGTRAFPKKGEVENAFTPPWLVLSFDKQRVCVETGALHCQICGSKTPVPLTQYVEHRMVLCPGQSHHN